MGALSRAAALAALLWGPPGCTEDRGSGRQGDTPTGEGEGEGPAEGEGEGEGEGPPPPLSCDDATDAQAMRAVYDGPKVPPGFYWDAPEERAGPQWREPCSPDLGTTRDLAADLFGPESLTGAERTTDWFHEVDATVNNGGHTIHVRQTRCDFWDGRRLAGAPPNDAEPLGFLAGYLWWTQNHNIGGHAILGGQGMVGNASNFYELCHVTTVFGDFGLCDQIALHRSRYRIGQFEGDVDLLDVERLRNVRGRCN